MGLKPTKGAPQVSVTAESPAVGTPIVTDPGIVYGITGGRRGVRVEVPWALTAPP